MQLGEGAVRPVNLTAADCHKADVLPTVTASQTLNGGHEGQDLRAPSAGTASGSGQSSPAAASKPASNSPAPRKVGPSPKPGSSPKLSPQPGQQQPKPSPAPKQPQQEPGPAVVTKDDYAVLARAVGRVQASAYDASRHHLSGPAMALVADNTGAPIVSATRHGAGRAVAFGNEALFNLCCSAEGGVGKLIVNAANWAAGGREGLLRIAGAHSSTAEDGIVAALARRNTARWRSLGTVPPSSLSRAAVDVYFINREDSALQRQAPRIRQFVAAGGGLVIAFQAWSWEQDGKPLAAHPANLILNPMGIGVGGVKDVIHVDASMDPATPPSQIANSDVAMDCLEATCTGNSSSPCQLATDDQMNDVMTALGNGAAFQAPGSPFWTRLQQWQAAASQGGINPGRPIDRNSAEGLGALARTISYKYLDPSKMPAAPDARFFPGLPAEGTRPLAGPIARMITGTTTTSYWQCTGMYAMAGQLVTVRVPPQLLGKGPVWLHIGGWTDPLYKKAQWVRLPELVRWFSARSTATQIASAHGGLIYITLPAGLSLGPLPVHITGAIMASMYREGVTNPRDWASILQQSPAPWGEIGGGKLVIASPASSLRKVQNPSAVVGYWDRVQDSNAWLANIPAQRPAPMRIQHDVDIATGYMHSGYPIMTYMDVTDTALDIKANHFPFLHELGHNHQVAAWTWGCTLEVTCNLFAARAMVAVSNDTDPATLYGQLPDATQRQRARQQYFAGGPAYATLCANPELVEDSYLALLESKGFGFALLRDTFRSYQQIPPSQVPVSDDAKLQTWVVQQSRAAGLDLAPYYSLWGWPVSKATQAALTSLPKADVAGIV
ncbi:hypothetical protein N2152v2_009373 [Parachlorella kessleri]